MWWLKFRWLWQLNGWCGPTCEYLWDVFLLIIVILCSVRRILLLVECHAAAHFECLNERRRTVNGDDSDDKARIMIKFNAGGVVEREFHLVHIILRLVAFVYFLMLTHVSSFADWRRSSSLCSVAHSMILARNWKAKFIISHTITFVLVSFD